jgi:hypothetical protein|tara:strand:+ start:97 stop:819 length:723 start_codon:yes stop_codon:yes gene_type:complete
MAAIAAMSLGSLAALPKAMRGRRNGGEVNRIRGSASARPIVRPAAAARGAEIRTRAVANVGVAMMPGLGADGVWDPLGLGRQKGWEVGDNDWNSDERRLEGSGSVMAMTRGGRSVKAMNTGAGGSGDFMNDLMNSKLPGKIGTVLLLLILSRVGTYIPISGVDRDAFAESLQGGGNVLSYVDTLTGGSISKLGIFSLGIVPFINSSIIFQVSDIPRELGSVLPQRPTSPPSSQSTGDDMT